jgi:hypothetical protein
MLGTNAKERTPPGEAIRVEIDRVLLSPAQRRIEVRPERRRPGRHMVIEGRMHRLLAAARRAARLRWSTAVRHFSAVIDEAADEAGLSMASILLVQARPR